MLVAGAVGAVSGAAIAGLTRSLDKGDLKDLGDQLDSSTTVIVVVTNQDSVKAVMDNLERATQFATTNGEVDWDDEDLKDQFTPVGQVEEAVVVAVAEAAETSWSGEGDPPPGYTIKGNQQSMLYHTPDSHTYGQTIAEIWFDSEESAQAAGYTKAGDTA